MNIINSINTILIMKNPLAEYNKKRDFTQTKEPEGKIEITKNFRFVIQKHEATRLHYDFRIEHHGVLVSWAVPKGLPYKSSERHLAMHVEDHPLSYFDFEGVIPEGNYGAGNVIVWDVGNYWVPHAENADEVNKKIDEGFKKGEIKLVLNGKKVKGLFALVKFKKAGDEAWLMIKDKDEYEGKSFLEDDKSVKTGKTLKQISKEQKASELKFISPMRATLAQEPFDNPDYLFEEKLDGYRVIAVINHDDVTLYSRNEEVMNNKFPEIVEELSLLGLQCVLDGEVVAYDKKGNASFQLMQNHGEKRDVIYHIFDILNLNGIETIKLPLIERKKYLKKIIKSKGKIQIAKYVIGKGKALFKKTLKTNEGIIAKKLNSEYCPGERSGDWIKIKNVMREEFVIGGITKPKGTRKGFGSLIVGYYKGDKLIYAGHVGTGIDDKLMKTLTSTFEKIKRETSPFADYDGDKTVQFWVDPIIICEVNFAEWTSDNMIRQGSFVGIRTDKFPKQVKNEYTLFENILTNPQKIYFPEKKYTKLDLAKYYFEISSIILPYLKDRPQNLNRQPDGISGKSFYQKDIEFELPDFVETIDIERDDEKSGDKFIKYILCQNTESLIYMANLGCIEINPWLSTIQDLERPDYLVFDIDPNDVDFKNIIKVVKDLYEFLEDIKVYPFMKTSGKRGLHIYAYLGAKYTYDESRNFAELIARMFENKYPELISLERSPNDRKNKIYIDYLQNRKGQTTASVYSARPTVNATVSMPISLSELDSKLDPAKFDIKNTIKRIDKYGDLWGTIEKKEVDLAKSLNLLKKSN